LFALLSLFLEREPSNYHLPVLSKVTAFISASIRVSSLVWNGCRAGPNLKQKNSFHFSKHQGQLFGMERLQGWSKPKAKQCQKDTYGTVL
jgi:hypothetical protein